MTSTALAKSVAPLRDTLASLEPSYAKLLPKWYPPSRLITGAMVAAQANPTLLKCNPRSVALALARVAQWGLDVGDTAHLVPYGETCTAVADYKGLIRLMTQAGARKVEAREVRQGDEFEYRFGSEPYLRHVPVGPSNRPFTHGYAIVWLRGGVTQFEVAPVEEIEAVKERYSRQWKGKPLEAWYIRKTLIRRLAKYVDRTPQLAKAVLDEGFDPETGEIVQSPDAEFDIPVDHSDPSRTRKPDSPVEAGDAAEGDAEMPF
ncbi:MAG: recombinase RecT [Gemmatimonadales bacterium]|nr:recombinase RecT [Gemmatimonadales bacterium]